MVNQDICPSAASQSADDSWIDRVLESVDLDPLDRDRLRELLGSGVHEYGNLIGREYISEIPAHTDRIRLERDQFESSLRTVWGDALDAFDVSIDAFHHLGAEFNDTHQPVADEENSSQFKVLVRCHARACRTATEVAALLRSGLAHGAMARWRSIHELAIVSFLIRRDTSDLAERYLEHHNVGAYKDMVEYNEHAAKLGIESFEEADIEQMRAVVEALTDRFGSKFKKTLGWASDIADKKNPTWKDLEDAAGLKHLRPYYSWASTDIHASPRGSEQSQIKTNDGLVLESGPNTAGLADPASATLVSLNQITVCLLSWIPNEDTLSVEERLKWFVILRALNDLSDVAHQQLLDAHQIHEERLA